MEIEVSENLLAELDKLSDKAKEEKRYSFKEVAEYLDLALVVKEGTFRLDF